jgi:hypothetical protein
MNKINKSHEILGKKIDQAWETNGQKA